MKPLQEVQLCRRNFLKVSAATTVVTLLSTTPLARTLAYAQGEVPPLEVLNYALTLERLEATAYDRAIGSGLLSGDVLAYFQTFGDHEQTHVDTLVTTIQQLGGTPAPAQENYDFPTFTSQQEVLTFFHMVEELGAAAYLGAAPLLIQNDELLAAALSIHNVEGQHAAVLSDLIGDDVSPAFAEGKTMEQVLQEVTPLLMAGGPPGMPTTGRGGMFSQSGKHIAY